MTEPQVDVDLDALRDVLDHCWAQRDGDIMNGETPERVKMWERRVRACADAIESLTQAEPQVEAIAGEMIDAIVKDLLHGFEWTPSLGGDHLREILSKHLGERQGETIECWTNAKEIADLRNPANGVAIIHDQGSEDDEQANVRATLLLHLGESEPDTEAILIRRLAGESGTDRTNSTGISSELVGGTDRTERVGFKVGDRVEAPASGALGTVVELRPEIIVGVCVSWDHGAITWMAPANIRRSAGGEEREEGERHDMLLDFDAAVAGFREALDNLQCRCSVAERDSGHLVGCGRPDVDAEWSLLEEQIDRLRSALSEPVQMKEPYAWAVIENPVFCDRAYMTREEAEKGAYEGGRIIPLFADRSEVTK